MVFLVFHLTIATKTTMIIVILIMMITLIINQPDQRALPGVPLDDRGRHRLLHHDAHGDNLEIYGRGAHYAKQSEKALFLLLQ